MEERGEVTKSDLSRGSEWDRRKGRKPTAHTVPEKHPWVVASLQKEGKKKRYTFLSQVAQLIPGILGRKRTLSQ